MEIKNSSSLKVLLTMASLVVVLAGIKAASAIVVPFLLSVFIAIACNPLIRRASHYHIPKTVSVALLILIMVIFGFMLAGLVGQSMNDFTQNVPEYKSQLASELAWLAEQGALLNIQIDRTQLLSYLDPGLAMSMVSNLLTSLGSVMTNFFLILLTVVFMLSEADTVPKKVHVALADPTIKIKHVDRFLSSVKDYLVIKTLISLLTGAIVGLVLYLMGLDHFMLWAVLAFLLNYIPNIGSILAAVPPVLLAIVQFGPAMAGVVALFYIALNTLMGNIIEPRFMGRGLGLSTLVVFLSLIFWGWLLGAVGMLLSVLLTMIVKIALESTQGGRWFAILLGDGTQISTETDAETVAAKT